MPLIAPKPEGGTFEKVPSGVYIARCYKVVDLGSREVQWQGDTKWQRKIRLTWELPLKQMADGKPFAISKRYTLSMADNANLRKDVENWIGRKLTDDEADYFDVCQLIGLYCQIQVMHSEDGKYANVTSIMPLPEGTTLPEPFNYNFYLGLTHQDFDQMAFDQLSEKDRQEIGSTKEYLDIQAITGNPAYQNTQPPF